MHQQNVGTRDVDIKIIQQPLGFRAEEEASLAVSQALFALSCKVWVREPELKDTLKSKVAHNQWKQRDGQKSVYCNACGTTSAEPHRSRLQFKKTTAISFDRYGNCLRPGNDTTIFC